MLIEDVLVLMLPVLALVVCLVAIVLAHQRRLAELKYNRPAVESDEVLTMRRELAELKEMVHTQMLALDVYSRGAAKQSVVEPVESRQVVNGRS